MAILGSGEYTYEIGGDNWGNLPEGWSFKEAAGVAANSKDQVHIFTRGEHPVIVFDSEGNCLRSWGEDDNFVNPHGIAAAPDDSIVCVDNADHTVRVYTPEGKLRLTLGDAGKPAAAMSGDPFNQPTHAVVDPNDGAIYVADGYANARVHKYDNDGRHLFSWGESGTDPGQFNVVHNIAVDNDGWVYIGDRENHRIQVFSSNGVYETQWVNLARTAGVFIDLRGDQNVYLAELWIAIASNAEGERLGPRVSILDRNGKTLARLGEEPPGGTAGRFYAPHGISVDSKGDIYVAEVSNSEYGAKHDPPLSGLRTMRKLTKRT